MPIRFVQMFVSALLRIYELLFVVRAIISWFPMFQGNVLTEFLYAATEPILAPIREFLRKIPGLDGIPIDFSVLVAFLLIDALRMIIF